MVPTGKRATGSTGPWAAQSDARESESGTFCGAHGVRALPVGSFIGERLELLHNFAETSQCATFRLINSVARHLERGGDGFWGFAVDSRSLEDALGAVGDGAIGKELAQGDFKERFAVGGVIIWIRSRGSATLPFRSRQARPSRFGRSKLRPSRFGKELGLVLFFAERGSGLVAEDPREEVVEMTFFVWCVMVGR